MGRGTLRMRDGQERDGEVTMSGEKKTEEHNVETTVTGRAGSCRTCYWHVEGG